MESPPVAAQCPGAEVRLSPRQQHSLHLPLSALSLSQLAHHSFFYDPAGRWLRKHPRPGVSLGPAIPATAVCCMTLVVTTSLSSIQQLLSETEMSGDGEFDKLELRNRTVTETLSPVEDLGQDKKVMNRL